MEHETISWSALEYNREKKRPDWYIALTIITIAFIVFGILTKNILFSILIAVSSITLALFSARSPRRHEYRIDSSGVWIGKTFHQYKTLRDFSITKDNPPRLLIRQKNISTGYLVLPLEDVDPELIYNALSTNISHGEFGEPVSVKIMEYLGF